MTATIAELPGRGRTMLRYGGMLFLALCAATLAWNGAARVILAAAHPAPGVMVDVGDHRLHLLCMGDADGAPVAMLEAGNADFSVMWAKVQPALAAHMRVCSYDRAGLGWSERGTAPRTFEAMRTDFETLLERAGITGPLVLVGHSFGGILVRDYAARHPGRVSAMVLLNPAHERQMAASPRMADAVAAGVAQFEGLAPLSGLGLLAMLPGTIPDRGLPPDAQGDYASILATTGYFTVAAEETRMLPANLAALETMALGELPLTVISRGRMDVPPGADSALAEELEAGWAGLQDEIAGLSRRSRHLVAEGSGHHVQLDRPDLVVAAVREAAGR